MPPKRKPARKPVSRVPSVTPERLSRGWSGPQGTKVRLLAAGEVDRWLELLEPVEIAHEPSLLKALADGTLGWLLPTGLAGGPGTMLAAFGSELFGGNHLHAMAGLSAALVAEDRDGRLVGALHALPPAGVLAKVAAKGVAMETAMVGALAIVKIRAVAVDPQVRGIGIGAALLRRCVQLYWQLGYHVAYGQFRDDTGLEHYYGRQSFEVLGVGEGLSLSMILGVPFGIKPEPGERLFTRWRLT